MTENEAVAGARYRPGRLPVLVILVRLWPLCLSQIQYFFLVILLPLLNTAALSDLSPHKLPLERQTWSYNCDAAVAMATSQSLHLRLLGKHPEPARVERKPISLLFKMYLFDFNEIY